MSPEKREGKARLKEYKKYIREAWRTRKKYTKSRKRIT